MGMWLRGFTGHEHLDAFGLINMNARLYDPKLGRMLSVDNFVTAPESAIGYNRYTYGLNNPISYIDPSGNEPITIAIAIALAAKGAAIGAAVAATTYTAQAALSYGGLEHNFKLGGLLNSIGMGAANGAVSSGIGTLFIASGPLGSTGLVFREGARIVSHGFLGAGVSSIQGGDGWSGFASGLLSSAAGYGGSKIGGVFGTDVGGTLLSAGVGAASSAMTGGDPWMGAAIGAIGHLTNDLMHQAMDGGGDPDNIITRNAKAMNDTYTLGAVVPSAGIGFAGTSTAKSLMYGGRYAMSAAQKGAVAWEMKLAGRVMSRFATKVGFGGLIFGGIDMVVNKNYTFSGLLDMGGTAVGFVPGVGWAISAGYVVTNEFLKSTINMNIGQVIQSSPRIWLPPLNFGFGRH